MVAENKIFCLFERIIDKIEVSCTLNPKFKISSNSSMTNFCKSSKRNTLSKAKSIILPGVPTTISIPE